MQILPSNLYLEWRRQRLPAMILQETDNPPPPPERLLQAIWRHQRIRRGSLQTLDGRSVRILHPGFHNREAGPDFRQSLVQFDGEAPRTGDIEVDLESRHWQTHAHHRNPAFRQVLLHVVWSHPGAAPPDRPTLALAPILDAPLAELALWVDSDAAQAWPAKYKGACASAWSRLREGAARELLRQAGLARLRVKASRMQGRARQAGWEQALWEELFRALGYKQNTWPMQRLAEALPLMHAATGASGRSVASWQARLMGLSGLLPAEPPGKRAEAAAYVRSLWDFWWRDQAGFLDQALPKTVWRFNGIRPANHPLRRLALAAHWLSASPLPSRLESWFIHRSTDPAMDASLGLCLAAGPDEFWDRHYTFRSPPLAKPLPLLGGGRISDLAINVVIPWFWVRAEAGGNPGMLLKSELLYLHWPVAEDNAVLRQARQRLFSAPSGLRFRTAAEQQGLLQITRDFCGQTNSLCAGCPFPSLVDSLRDCQVPQNTGNSPLRPHG